MNHAQFIFNMSFSEFSDLLVSIYSKYGLPLEEIELGRNDLLDINVMFPNYQIS